MLAETSWRRVWIPLMSLKAIILSTLSPGSSAKKMSMLKTLFRLEKPSWKNSSRLVPQDSTKRSRGRWLPWRKASSEERIQWNSVTQDWYLQGWRHWWVLERLTWMTCWSTNWHQFPCPSSMRKVVISGFQSQSPSSSEDSRWKLPIPQEIPDTLWLCHEGVHTFYRCVLWTEVRSIRHNVFNPLQCMGITHWAKGGLYPSETKVTAAYCGSL